MDENSQAYLWKNGQKEKLENVQMKNIDMILPGGIETLEFVNAHLNNHHQLAYVTPNKISAR